MASCGQHYCPLNCCGFLKLIEPMKLRHLKQIEDHLASTSCCPHLPMKDFFFAECPISGTTPMILACRHGELDSVKHLVETCGVSVQSTAKYFLYSSAELSGDASEPKKHVIRKASPLFVAAFHGHNLIVRYLLDKGADVSVKTCDEIGSKYDGLTPLYGAVCEQPPQYPQKGSFQLLKEKSAVVQSLLEYGADPNTDSFRPGGGEPMWKERLCGAVAITALINHGLDVKLFGGAILNYMKVQTIHNKITEEDTLAIVQQVVEKGADLWERNTRGFTPLLMAIDDSNGYGCINLPVFDFFLEREEYSPMEKIEAMELAGAAILFNDKCSRHYPKAFDYWYRALNLRHELVTAEDSGSSYKKILGPKIGENVEWTTRAELDKLMKQPDEYKIQALLVKLRNLSGFDGHFHQYLSADYITYLSKSTRLENGEKFNQILDIIWGVFDNQIIRRSEPLSTDAGLSIYMVLGAVKTLESTFSTLLEENHPTLLNFETLILTLDLVLLLATQDIYDRDMVRDSEEQFLHFSQFLTRLLEVIFRLPETSSEHNLNLLIQSLRELASPRKLGNLLLQVCKKLCKSYHLALVRVLLVAGADPNMVDENKQTSLHIAARIDRELGDALCLLLVEFGAKLHQVNRQRQTAMDIWIELNETRNNRNGEAGEGSARPEWCCPLPTLLRLAARVTRVNKIPYLEAPSILHSLIEFRDN